MGKKCKYFSNQDLIDEINKIDDKNINASYFFNDAAIKVFFQSTCVLQIPEDAINVFEVQIIDKHIFLHQIRYGVVQFITEIIQEWLKTPRSDRKLPILKYRLRSPKFFQGEPMYVKTISLNCDYEPNFKVEFTTDKDLAAKFSEKELESLKFCYPMIGASLDDMKEQVE